MPLYPALVFSNSPYWYVDAGMTYSMGEDWKNSWDAIITSAGKPRFYTDEARPFREVSAKTGRIKFKKVRHGRARATACANSKLHFPELFALPFAGR